MFHSIIHHHHSSIIHHPLYSIPGTGDLFPPCLLMRHRIVPGAAWMSWLWNMDVPAPEYACMYRDTLVIYIYNIYR